MGAGCRGFESLYPDHFNLCEQATKLREAIIATLEAKDSLTPDLGGEGNTMSFAKAIAKRAA